MTGQRPRPTLHILTIVVLGAALVACAVESTVSVAPEVQLTAELPTQTLPAIKALPPVAGDQLPTADPNAPAAIATDAGERDFGPVIGPEYTQPPTSTQRPTLAPTATPIVTLPGSAYTTALPVDQTRLDPGQMGIQLHYNYDVDTWEYRMQQIVPLRVSWVKVQAAWEWLQPDRQGQFERNFRLFQLHVQKADKYGFQVMLSVVKAPDWSRHTNRSEDGPPDDLNQLASFLRQLMEQVGPYVDAIEIWNEPNLRREWTGNRPISGASYMELFRVAYDTIRAYSPTISIVTAGLAPTGNHSGVSVDDRAFLRQMYQAGLARYPDVKIGVHPYSWGNPPDFLCCNNVEGQGWDDHPQFFFRQTLRDYAGIIAAYGDKSKMWVTEFGWATWEDFPSAAPDPWMAYNSAQDQMDYTMRAFQIGQSRGDIAVMILWNLSYAVEHTVYARSELAAYSLLFPYFDGSGNQHRRPLYRALERRP
ncbi:MAG: cellulase family glycosylhydrolase [Chloroflexi bacterium]|nr:cellulase family glycosylhydrolase [Chloroflexota bacterium]